MYEWNLCSPDRIVIVSPDFGVISRGDGSCRKARHGDRDLSGVQILLGVRGGGDFPWSALAYHRDDCYHQYWKQNGSDDSILK